MKKFVLIVCISLLFVATVFAQEFNQVTSQFSGIQYTNASTKPCVTDFDGDGLLDLLIGSLHDYKIAHWEQETSGSTTFIHRTSNFNNITLIESAPAITDIDGDNLLDLIIGSQDGTLVHYEQSAANSTTFNHITDLFNSIDVGTNSTPFFWDLDADDRLDLFIGEIWGALTHYEQDSPAAGTFTYVTSTINNIDVGGCSAPFVNDYNNDNLMDMFVGESSGNINHYIQDAPYANSFTLDNENYSNIQVTGESAPCFTDIGNDSSSYPDLLLGKNYSNIEHWEVTPSVITDAVTSIEPNSAVWCNCGPECNTLF